MIEERSRGNEGKAIATKIVLLPLPFTQELPYQMLLLFPTYELS